MEEQQLRHQIERVIQFSQNIPADVTFNLENFITNWLNAKSHFIKAFGGKYIFEGPKMTFQASEEDRKKTLDNFISTIDLYYPNNSLISFLRDIRIQDFYNNKTSKRYEIDDDIIIPKGIKVVKSFKYFYTNSETLHTVQDLASRCIQDNEITGTVCLSVHPLDFLSASENVHNWRSCHSLDGDYRAGNLSYLMDSSTIMCYLRADGEYVLPNFPSDVPWNSKKWRMWIHFSNDESIIFFGREYPFHLSSQIFDYIKYDLFKKCGFENYGPNCSKFISSFSAERAGLHFTFKSYLPIGFELKTLKDIIQNGNNNLAFNDLLNSSVYSPIWAYQENKDLMLNGITPSFYSGSDTKVILGESCPCPICGKENLFETDCMVCASCAEEYGLYENEEYEQYCTCSICGDAYPEDEMHMLDYSEELVCDDCWNNSQLLACCHNPHCRGVDRLEYFKIINNEYYCKECLRGGLEV